MYNYFNYNNSQINDLAIVTKIEKPYIPERTINTIDISSRDGMVYDGAKYTAIKIPISLAIVGNDKEDYQNRVKILHDLLSAKEIVPIKFCDTCTIYGMVNSDFVVTKKNFCTGYADIEIICFDPFSYSNYILEFSENSTSKKVTVQNGGQVSTLPFITVGIDADTHFVQIQNIDTGERILVGDYPKLTLSQKKEQTLALYDKCESLSGFTVTGANIDTDRSYGGTFALSDSGASIRLSTLSTGSTTWNGACARRAIGTTLDEFELRINMQHNSTGKNGDPNIYDSDSLSVKEEVKSGTLTTWYECTKSKVNCRKGPGMDYKVVGTISKGYTIKSGTVTSNGSWIKYTHTKYGTVYTSLSVLTKRQTDTRTSEVQTFTVCNMWLQPKDGNKTGAGNTLWSDYTTDSKAVCVIPYGTVLRIIKRPYTSKKDGKTIYYRLYKKYKDTYSGYIQADYLVDAYEMSNNAVDYSDDPGYADDKTGMVELYGFDVNGNKLFKMGLYDDNEYFEYTRPEIQIGNRVVLKDTNKTPTPKTKVTSSNNNNKITTYLSGKYGDWNEFDGTFYLTRKKVSGQYVWSCSVKKLNTNRQVVKTQSVNNIKYSDLPTAELSYLAVYMGTKASSTTKLSGVGLSHISVYNLNPESEEEQDIIYFQEGDVIELDFENGNCYVNNKLRNDLVDIGSTYFPIQPGESTIAINSDDTTASMSITLQERWVGVVDNDLATIPEDSGDVESTE